MRKALMLLFAIGLILGGTVYTHADLYKWVDEEGVVHFSDTPPVGEKEVETFKTPTYSPPAPETKPEEPQTTLQIEQPADAPSVVISKPKPRYSQSNQVELYTTSWCKYCKDAAAFLRQNNIAFQEFDVEKDVNSLKRMRSLGGTGGVPFALINGKTVSGFSAGLYKRALGLR